MKRDFGSFVKKVLDWGMVAVLSLIVIILVIMILQGCAPPPEVVIEPTSTLVPTVENKVTPTPTVDWFTPRPTYTTDEYKEFLRENLEDYFERFRSLKPTAEHYLQAEKFYSEKFYYWGSLALDVDNLMFDMPKNGTPLSQAFAKLHSATFTFYEAVDIFLSAPSTNQYMNVILAYENLSSRVNTLEFYLNELEE